jgi:23S rRNA (cytidine1920-2'-O)/16S rRNA (cytidine1409-2'-O)-methyltransferase
MHEATTMRADLLIVGRGLAPTRSAAQRLIERGAVRWRVHAQGTWALPRKAGDELPAACELEVTDDAELRWASRAGLKLDAALMHTGIDVQGRLCLDVGQSTGGFTDVLLARGAAHVTGVDVGHGQLHPRLRGDARVVALEGVNARRLSAAPLPHAGYGLVVGDLSFISLALVLPALAPLVQGDLLLLVKPQFELQRGESLRTPGLGTRIEQRLRAACGDAGLVVHGYFDSAVAGGDGNREHFLWARPS